EKTHGTGDPQGAKRRKPRCARAELSKPAVLCNSNLITKIMPHVLSTTADPDRTAGIFARIPGPPVPADIPRNYALNCCRRISRTGRRISGPISQTDTRQRPSGRVG